MLACVLIFNRRFLAEGSATAAHPHIVCVPSSRVTDLLIAATAHAHSARIYTRNADDFVGTDAFVEVVSA